QGHVRQASPVVVNVIAPGSATLVRLDAERLSLLYGSPKKQIQVQGVYADGVRRELTHAKGILYEMDAQTPRNPDYPYNGTGVAPGDGGGLGPARRRGATVCHIGYAGLHVDVVVGVAEIQPVLMVTKPGLISWPYQGSGVTYDLARGKLSGLRATRG